jgi:hypothetical protein
MVSRPYLVFNKGGQTGIIIMQIGLLRDGRELKGKSLRGEKL